VQWKKGGTVARTWKDIATIKYQFLDFNLEDKIVSAEGVMLGTRKMRAIKKGEFIIVEN